MEYRVDGTIKFHPTTKLKLGEALSFSTPSGAQITLNPTDGSELAVAITLEADSNTAASYSAELELERISSHLSYLKNVPILGTEVKTMARRDSKSTQYRKTGTTKAHIIVPSQFEPKDVEKLADYFAKEGRLCAGGICFKEVVSLWKQAISTKSPELKYLLLYRLMESLFEEDSRIKRITNWICCKDPSAEPKYPPFRGKNKITVYTYTRNQIHTKGDLFPSAKIDDLLPKIQNLVREAIKGKCGINYA